MRTLSDHIKKRQFKRVYLIYGPEVYLRLQYRNRLVAALVGSDGTVNCNYFEGKDPDIHEIIGFCETMPFFAEYRAVVVENSGLFAPKKKDNESPASPMEELTDYISRIPETTCLIFVDEAADKRSRLFKEISRIGYAANMSRPSEKDLKLWIGSTLKKAGKKITERTADHLMNIVDNDMENMRQELEKLICYTGTRDVVTDADVDEICSVHIENRIFDMIDAMAIKNQKRAMRRYGDLLALREAPMKILYLIARQFNTLLQIKELTVRGYSAAVIAERTGMRDYVVRKNIDLTRKFSLEELKGILALCAELEEAVKAGRMADRIAVDLLVIRCSA